MYDIDWRHWIHISDITTRIINKVALCGVYQDWAQRCVAHRELPNWGTVGITSPRGLSSRVKATLREGGMVPGWEVLPQQRPR